MSSAGCRGVLGPCREPPPGTAPAAARTGLPHGCPRASPPKPFPHTSASAAGRACRPWGRERVVSPARGAAARGELAAVALLMAAAVERGRSDALIGIGAAGSCPAVPCHTTGHAGPHPAVRNVEVTWQAEVHAAHRSSGSVRQSGWAPQSISTNSEYSLRLDAL
jgi:hypothetical protein